MIAYFASGKKFKNWNISCLAVSQPTEEATTSNECTKKEEVYDDEYFSSGSEDDNLVGGVPSKSKQRRKVMSNDELFYDPEMDDNDEKWVNKQREMNALLGNV